MSLEAWQTSNLPWSEQSAQIGSRLLWRQRSGNEPSCIKASFNYCTGMAIGRRFSKQTCVRVKSWAGTLARSRQAGNRNRRRRQWKCEVRGGALLAGSISLAQRQWCLARHPCFCRFVLLSFVGVAGRCVAGAGSLEIAPEGPPFC